MPLLCVKYFTIYRNRVKAIATKDVMKEIFSFQWFWASKLELPFVSDWKTSSKVKSDNIHDLQASGSTCIHIPWGNV